MKKFRYLLVIPIFLLTACDQGMQNQTGHLYFDLNELLSLQFEKVKADGSIKVEKHLNYNGKTETKIVDTITLGQLSTFMEDMDINRPAYRGAYVIDETDFISANGNHYPSIGYRLREGDDAAVQYFRVVYNHDRQPMVVTISRNTTNPLYSLRQMVVVTLNNDLLHHIYIQGQQKVIMLEQDNYMLNYFFKYN